MHKYYVLMYNNCYVTMHDHADRAYSKLLCDAYFWLDLGCAKEYARTYGYAVVEVTMILEDNYGHV